MRRTLAYLLFSAAAGIGLYHSWLERFPWHAALALSLLCLFAAAAAGFFAYRLSQGLARHIGSQPPKSDEGLRADARRDLRAAALLLITAVLCVFYMAVWEQWADPLEAVCGGGQRVELAGTVVCVVDKGEGSWQLELRSGLGKTLVKVNKEDGQFGPRGCCELTGRRILVRGTAELPAGQQNPGTFDYRLYLKGKGVRVILSTQAAAVKILADPPSLIHALAVFRFDFFQALKPYMQEENRGILAGMLFGDRSMMSEDVYEMFQKNGTAHLLAVSGLHVGAVYACMDRLFRRRRTVPATLCISFFLYLYAALACFSPSVCRALVMILLHRLSLHLHMRYDLLTAASFTALLMLILNPFQLFHTGFQLSYLAVIGMAFSMPLVSHFLSRKQYRGWRQPAAAAGKVFLPAAAIQLGTAPITAFLFHTFSFAAFLINVPAIFLGSLILPVGLAAGILSFAGGPPFQLAAFLSDFLTDTLVTLNTLFYGTGISSCLVTSPPFLLICLYYGGALFLCSEFAWLCLKTSDHRPAAAALTVIVSLSLLLSWASGAFQPKPDMVFVAVGQGDCLHIRTPEGKQVLIDSGGSPHYDVGKKILEPYLLSNGVRKLDLVLITHLHEDHYGGFCSLAKDLPVRYLGVCEAYRPREKEILKETGLAEDQLIYLRAGDRIPLENSVTLEIMAPEATWTDGALQNDAETDGPGENGTPQTSLPDPEDENSYSLVVRVYYGHTTVLMTADIGFPGEELLLQSCRDFRSDILKVAHHGSRYSTGEAFLQAASPQAAVIQVGKNNYGHPHPDTIEKLKKYDIMVFRTDLEGAVLVDVEKQGAAIRSWLPRSAP